MTATARACLVAAMVSAAACGGSAAVEGQGGGSGGTAGHGSGGTGGKNEAHRPQQYGDLRAGLGSCLF